MPATQIPEQPRPPHPMVPHGFRTLRGILHSLTIPFVAADEATQATAAVLQQHGVPTVPPKDSVSVKNLRLSSCAGCARRVGCQHKAPVPSAFIQMYFDHPVSSGACSDYLAH